MRKVLKTNIHSLTVQEIESAEADIYVLTALGVWLQGTGSSSAFKGFSQRTAGVSLILSHTLFFMLCNASLEPDLMPSQFVHFQELPAFREHRFQSHILQL